MATRAAIWRRPDSPLALRPSSARRIAAAGTTALYQGPELSYWPRRERGNPERQRPPPCRAGLLGCRC
jgi:hypothetical protein